MQFSPLQERCIAIIEKAKATAKCRGCHSLRSAVAHLRKAWALRAIDKEMAVFRAITAEEEAATALIYALQYRQYDNANLLNPWNHVHKSAVSPFLEVMGLFFEELFAPSGIKPKLHLKEKEGEGQIGIALPMTVNGEEKLGYPIPPLNFSITSDDKTPRFTQQIAKFLTQKNAERMSDYVRGLANKRNEVLYATDKGIPVVEKAPDGFFTLRKDRAMVMLIGYLLIEPYAERSPFVQGALDAYLVMLGKIDGKHLHPEL